MFVFLFYAVAVGGNVWAATGNLNWGAAAFLTILLSDNLIDRLAKAIKDK